MVRTEQVLREWQVLMAHFMAEVGVAGRHLITVLRLVKAAMAVEAES